jgi:hypothetical protein
MNQFTRLLVLTSIPFFWTTPIFPQSRDTPGKENDLYSMAFVASVTEMERSWGYIDDGDNGSRTRTDYNRLVVRQDSEITDPLPTQFGTHHVEYLDDRALIDRYKTLRKEFATLEIHPMHNDGAELKIQVSVSWIKFEKGRLIFQFSDWSDVKFRFDCEKHAYTISEVKLGGI